MTPYEVGQEGSRCEVNGTDQELAEILSILFNTVSASVEHAPVAQAPFHWQKHAWLEFVIGHSRPAVLAFVAQTLLQATDGEMDVNSASSVMKGCSRVVRKMKEIIYAESAAGLTVAEVARRVFVSSNYASRLFKQETGQTITDYLIQVRIERAKTLLLEDPPLKTYRIGELVGYPEPVYFTKLFKRLVGMTPKQYRNHNLK